MTEHSGRLVQHTLLYFPAQFFPAFAQLAMTIAFTYLLSAEDLGVLMLLIVSQELTAMVGVNWWSLFILRFRARYQAIDEARFRSMDNMMVNCAIIAQFLLAPPILWIAGVAVNVPLYGATVGFFVSRMLLMHYGSWARADLLVDAYSISQLIGSVGGACLAVGALWLFGPHQWLALVAFSLANFSALYALFSMTKLSFRFGRFDREIFLSAIDYGVPLIVANAFGWIASNIIRMVVQIIEGATALGLLSVGWGLGQRIAAVLSMIYTTAAYPLAVQLLEQGDRKGALRQVSLNGLLLLGTLVPAVVGVACLAAPIVNLLVGPSFRSVTIAILPLALLTASIRALRIHTSDMAMILFERTRMPMWENILESVAGLILCGIGSHYAGVVGATMGVLIGATVICVLSFAYSIYFLELPLPSVATLTRIGVAAGGMIGIIHLMPQPHNILSLGGVISVGAGAYSVAILLLFRECREAVSTRFAKHTISAASGA